MRTESAVTGASGIPVGFAALSLVYAGLVAVAVVMLRGSAGSRSRSRADAARPRRGAPAARR